MASEIGSFVVSLKAKIEGYQTELKKILDAMNLIGADTKIGKNLAKQFKSVSSDVEKLEQKINLRISSETLIVRLKDLLDGVDSKIRDIGGTLLQVQFKDLDTTKFTASIQEMSTKLKELETQLSNNMGGSFNKIIQGWLGKSDNKFGNLLDRLKIDPKELNYENFSQVFTKAMEDARARALDLKKEIEDLTKQKEQYDRLASEADNRANFNPTDAVNQSLGKFANVNVKELSLDKIKEFLNNLTKFFLDINLEPDILEKKVLPLIDNLVNSTSSGEFQRKLAQFEGNLAKSLGMNKTNVDLLLLNTLNIDPKLFFNFDNFLDTSKINEFSTEVSNLLNNLMPDKSSDEISATYETVFKAFTNGSPAEAIKAVTAALLEYLKEQQAVATSNKSSSEAIGQTIKDLTSELKQIPKDIQSGNGYLSVLQSNYNSLLQKYDELKQLVEELRSLLRDAGKNAEGNVHTAGTNILQSGLSGLAENIRLAKQYSQELESVKNAELMVGKIEGITQRWFSVYAAVRIVTNAINSMKQTIAELDKTITEIAIVTDMSQSDLWGLMDSYTSMAREYAASISGVYKVSQLYYQQGLLTADVMALTESTLKMARISGLDYADATNYMTNAVRSFKMEMTEADRVVDVYSAIAAKSATDVSELAVAMSKTASSAEAVGSSFENTTAMMAVMIEATRESSLNIGSAMKSIISRYGELKEDPSKLVDSEGEELSLNKVDKALQSVGISIHNAQGQFREFDDVIMELAEAWDTIDVNTLRYIATVMAGNRQQSRFLALVGSGERLKQLAADAADAENASQLQFLKTLDSIGAKLQQLETSLLSLYTSSGLEQFYKWILDVGNAIVTQFNNIPRLFNLPIPAILSFASTFYSLADVVTNVFGIIMNRMAVHRQQLEASLSNSANTLVLIEVNKNNLTLAALKEGNTKQEQEQVRHENAMEKIKATHGRITTWANGRPADFVPGGENKQYGNVKTVNTTSLGLNLASLGFGAIATSLKGFNNSGALRAGGFVGIGSRALSGAAMGSMIPGVGTGVGATIGIIIGAFENLNAILPSTKVLIENLTKAATEANNKALQELAESKSLLSSIDKLNELAKARYSSVEAELKFIDANNELAGKYPQLISYYDESGNAMISLSNANQMLTLSLNSTTEAAIAAAAANFSRAKKEEENTDKELAEANVTTKNEAQAAISGIIRGEIGSDNLLSETDLKERTDWLSQVSEGAATSIDNIIDSIEADTENTAESKKLTDLLKDFAKQTDATLEQWLKDRQGKFLDIATNVDYTPTNRNIGTAFLDILDSYLRYQTGTEAAFNRTNEEIKSGVLTTVKNLYNSAKNDETKKDLIESLDETEGGYLLLQLYAVESVQSLRDTFVKDSDFTDALKNLNLKDLWDEIKSLIPDGKSLNDLLNKYGSLNSTEFKKEAENFFSGNEISEQFMNALLAPYKDEYTVEMFKNNTNLIDDSKIKESLSDLSEDFLSTLTGSLLLNITKFALLLEKLTQNNNLTSEQAGELLSLYINILTTLEAGKSGLGEEDLATVSLLLNSWDGTREGLEAVLAAIPENDATKSLLELVANLLESIPLNLNTIFSTLASSVAGGIKEFDAAIADMAKGVSMDKAVEYADKFGADISKFELDYSTGLFKYDDLNVLQLKYFDNLNEQITNAYSYLGKYTDTKNEASIDTIIGLVNDGTPIKDIADSYFDQIKDLERGEIESELQAYIEYSKTAGDNALGFTEWITNKYKGIAEISEQALLNAQARGALLLGDISGFVETLVGKDSDFKDIITNSIIGNGKIDINDIKSSVESSGRALPDWIILLLEQYINTVSDTFKDTTTNLYETAISTVTLGALSIKVTEANYKELSKLTGKELTREDKGSSIIIDWSDTDINNYLQRVGLILSSGMNPEEIDALLEALEKAVYKNKPSEILNNVISNHEGFGILLANKYAKMVGSDVDSLVNAGILHLNKFTGEYSVTLLQARTDIISSWQKGEISLKEANQLLASIDSEIYNTSNSAIFLELGKDYNNVSEDLLASLATSLGTTTKYLKDYIFKDNGDGTYSIRSFQELINLYNSLELESDEAAKKTVQLVFDRYIELLSKIGAIQTSGYTKLEDMLKFADEIEHQGPLNSLYEWSDSLKAYVLSTEGVSAAASKANRDLKDAEKTGNADILKLLIQRTKLTLASNIDAMSFTSALQSGDTVELLKSANEFTKAVNDYAAYCAGLDESININADDLKSMLAAGGRSAVIAAQLIAAWKGETLNASDINTLYRSEIDKLNAASELLSYSIGEIINLNTWNILKGIDGFHASEIANGQYVVTSVGKLIEAHEALYKAMSETNEATVRELNAEWAKILNLKSGGEVVEYLSNAAEMTYEAFGEALASVGIEAASLKGSDLYKDLGNGKIEITNFEAFSALLGLSSESTEAYIAAYKEFNAQKIQHENQLRQAIEDEISSLSTAKLGDKIDLTTLYFKISEDARDRLEESLLEYGAVFDHGILDLSEATSIPNIINIIKNLMQSIDILTEQDFASLADALDNFLKNIVDLINKGIKGTLTNKDKLDLKNNLSNYGIDLNEYDFTKTSEGLLLTEQAAMRIWNQLNLIDKLLALLVFKELSASLIANNEKFRTMSSTMNRIVELLEKIATSGNKVSDARLNLYKAELAVAEEIAKVRATSADDSYKFMEADLPAALDNPINYIENWGKAFNVLKEGGKSGFIDAKDFARVVNEMNNIAGLSGEFEFFGKKLDGNLSSASSLIESAFSHIKSVDGKAVVDVKAMMKGLSDVGTAFETGALEADGKVTQGIHAVAQANIDMLDGMIAMLETIVGMQDALSNVDINFDNELNLEEIFPDLKGDPGKVTDEFADAADKILKKAEEYPDLKEALNTIQIDNHTLADLLKEAKDGAIEAEINYKAFADIMNSFYKMSLSDDYDENNIYESLKQVMEDSGMEDQNYDLNLKDIFITVHQGKVAKITWDDKNIKDVIEKYVELHGLENEKGKDGKTAQEQAKEALSKIFAKGNDNNPEVTLEGEELEYFVKLNGAKIVIDPNTKKSYYEYHGKPYRTAEDVLKAIKLELEFPQLKNLTTNYNPEDSGQGGEFTITASLGANLVVKITDSGRTYEYKGHQGETMDEAITAYLTLEDEDYRDLQTKEAQKEYLALYKLNNNLEDKPHFNLKTPKGFNPTQKDSKDFLDYLNNTEEINGKNLEEKFNIKTGIEGPLSVDLIKEVANLFGVDYAMEAKLLSLSVSLAEGTSATLLNLLTGESATATLEITPTIVGSTTSGEGTENGLQLGELLINAPIRINPTDVQLNGNTFLYDKALTVYAAVSNLKLLSGEGGTTAVEGGTGNPLSELAKALLKLIVDTIWSDDSVNTTRGLQALAYLGEILFATDEKTVNTPPKIVVPQDWIGEDSKLRVKEILTFLYNLEYKPTEAAKTATILVDTPGPLETIDIEQPYRIVFVPEGEGGENEPQQPAGLSMGAELIQGGIIAGNSDYYKYLTSMSEYLKKGGTLSQAGAESIKLIANATEVNPGTQAFYEKFFGKDGGLFNIDELGNISAMTTLLLDMGEALSDGELINNMLNLSTLVLEVNSTDSNGLAALWTVLTELKDAAATFMQGPWKDVTSVLNDLSSLNIEAKTLTIDIALTGETWIVELLKTLSALSVNLNVNANNGDDNQNPNKLPPQEEQPEPVLPSESGNPTSNINPTMTPPLNLQYPFVGAMGPMMPSGYVNPTMPMTAAFAPQLGVGMPLMQGAMPYGSMASTTPVTPSTQEQPELDTDELEKGIEKVNELISNISTSVDNITKAISEFTSQTDAVNGAISDIGSAVSTLQSSISTFATDAGTGASNAEDAAKALKGIPKNIPIDVNIKLKVSIDSGATGPLAKGTPNVEIVDVDPKEKKVKLSQAKGTNLALPRGNAQTLMGELGPELYVTNGRYYVAGQGGPEFVDLPKDAIVFNHVKTKLLLKNGKTSEHGKPVTNEKNAISFATGTPGGPAMASASAALAALKHLRAIWTSLLKSSAKDLGSLAGRGGGGGGDDAGKYVQPTTTTADIQRWYNWLRLIDKIEKDITYQEKLQKKYETDRVANGLKIFDTLKERLKLLDQEILRNERLADLQKSWYDNKRKELEESSYGKIFTYDENGLQQYVGSGKPGSGLGLDILEHLTRRDVRGEAIGDAATSKAQLKYLASVGFNLNDLIYNDDGTKVVKKINLKTLGLTRMPDDEDTDASELYTKLMENFWSKVDGWRDELDSLYDSYQQQLAKIEENLTKLNLIIEGFVKNELSVEKELLKAVEAREQAVIDKLQELKDALEKANANYIKGILKALEKERQIELKNDQQEDLTKLQRQLSILQRSGGGAAQIKQLQDQIAQSLKDMYFNDRLEEINAVQEASDKLLEKLDQQIQILSETLEYQKKNGLLWNQVREIMEGGDEFATAFYDKWVTSKSGESALNMEEDLRSFKESFQEWVGFRESKEEDRLAKEDMESIANSEKYGESNANYLEGFADDKERSAAQKAAEDAANTARDNYLKSHEDEDEASREANARAAAEKAYHESLQSSYMSTTGNKEANQLFAENYGSWLENRRISDANDFTNTETFKLNENVFKNAMQAYYLEHRNDEGVKEQELWQNAINAGQQALKEDIEENYLEALENSALVIGGKAVSYTWDSVKGKMKKNSKITYGEGTSLSFEEAKEVPEGKKVKHYLRVAGTDNWVLANGIYTGERIYSQLAGNQAWLTWQSQNGNLAGAINGMNGYYGANGLTNTVDISDLKSGSLKFPGTLIPLENGGFATLGKNGNTVRISDFSSITFDKKNPDKKISKLGKNMTITAILTPDMSKMENLLNPMTIKTNGTIKKKLNDLLAADRGSLKNLLQYLGNYDISEIRRYAAGGMNYSTGPAWLDGTKARPEAVLNSSQTSFLRNDLLGNSKDSLKSIVYSLQDSIRGAAIGSSSTTNNDGMVIENIDVTFSPGVISNDYDMRQASEVFKNEIVKIARKSGSRSVSRR